MRNRTEQPIGLLIDHAWDSFDKGLGNIGVQSMENSSFADDPLVIFNIGKMKLLLGNPEWRNSLSSAGQKGFLPADFLIGKALFHGKYNIKELDVARFHFERAAAGGHLLATFYLKRYFERGINLTRCIGLIETLFLIARAKYRDPNSILTAD